MTEILQSDDSVTAQARAATTELQVPQDPSELEPRIDLRERFPQSVRLVFAKTALFLLALVLVTTGYIALALQIPAANGGSTATAGNALEAVARIVFFMTVIVCGGKLLYELLFFMLYRYTIELEHLTITHGVFFRSRASCPLARINDVSITRGPIEIIFGIYTLTILTASPTDAHTSIEGLPSKSAHGLQSYLLALVETTLPDVRGRLASNRIERSAVA